MGNGCTFKGQSDAPVVDEDGGDRDKRQQPKGKQIRVVLVDSDFTDSEVDEAVKRILKGGNPVGGKNNNDNSSAFDSSCSEAPSSAASPTSPVSHEEPPELIAKGVPIKKKKLLKMGKKGRKGKQSKSKSGKSASKKSMSTPLSSLASSADSSSVNSSVNSSVQPPPPPPPLIKQPAKVTRKEIIKSTGPPPPAKTKTKNADSTFFSSPLRLPSDSEQENSSTVEEKGKQHLKESTPIQSSDDGGSSSDNANDAHTH